MEIVQINNYNVINLIDGKLISDAIKLVNDGQADGINFNFIKNFPSNIDEIKFASNIRYIQINDYAWDFDYSAVNHLSKLEHLSLYSTDRKEMNYLNFPILNSTALNWRPKAKSLFGCANLERLFIGRYSDVDLSRFEFLNNLKYLRINTGSIKTLKGIEKLNDIESLLLTQLTKLEDISGIETLTNLTLLRIDNCRNIKNIHILKNLKSSIRLEIVGTTPRLND